MKQIILFLLGVNAVALLFVALNYLNAKKPNTMLFHKDCSNKENSNITRNATPQYKFDNIVIAYHLLHHLDIFENSELDINQEVLSPYFGMKINDNYCDEHRSYFVNHPDDIFNKKNFIINDWNDSTIRSTIVPSIGQDLLPDVSYSMPSTKRNSLAFKVRPEVNIFYTLDEMWKYRVIGKQFSCLTQISNHCPGHENLEMKDKLGLDLAEYTNGYKTRPHCFNADKFFPQTWVMREPDQCKDFFNIFNSPEYLKLKEERNIVYVRKIAIASKNKGVFPVNDEEEIYIRALYDNGDNCDNVTENNSMQIYIHNPLLLQRQKFNFRVFLYVASVNPFIVYYHDGYLKISSEKNENLGMNELFNTNQIEQTKEDSDWFYPQLHQYLMEKGLVTDPNWLDNYLRTEMKKAMVHLIRMTQGSYLRKSSLSELYGIDFMMDEDLNLWFIEANSAPSIEGWDSKTTQFFHKMLRDMFEIAFGVLRSRTKRIINYINSVIKEKDTWALQKDTVLLQNLEERREEFKKVTMNRFEPEFEPSPDNGFHQIIDENLEGTDRYFDLLQKECL